MALWTACGIHVCAQPSNVHRQFVWQAIAFSWVAALNVSGHTSSPSCSVVSSSYFRPEQAGLQSGGGEGQVFSKQCRALRLSEVLVFCLCWLVFLQSLRKYKQAKIKFIDSAGLCYGIVLRTGSLTTFAG